MDALSKLCAACILLKRAEEEVIKDKPKKVQVKNWDTIKGIPSSDVNADVTDTLIPSAFDQPIDLGYNNKQTVSGSGYGALILGKYRNE